MNTEINVNILRNYWKVNVVYRALTVLKTKDRFKVGLLALIQIILSFLDLAGVAVIGMIGAITINGSASRPPGDRVSSILELLQLDNFELTKQVSILGVKSIVSGNSKTFNTRKRLYHYGRRYYDHQWHNLSLYFFSFRFSTFISDDCWFILCRP